MRIGQSGKRIVMLRGTVPIQEYAADPFQAAISYLPRLANRSRGLLSNRMKCGVTQVMVLNRVKQISIPKADMHNAIDIGRH